MIGLEHMQTSHRESLLEYYRRLFPYVVLILTIYSVYAVTMNAVLAYHWYIDPIPIFDVEPLPKWMLLADTALWSYVLYRGGKWLYNYRGEK